MPYDVLEKTTTLQKVAAALAKAGWRVKVFDAEGPETPHVTIRFKSESSWRVSLRDKSFLDGGGWSGIKREIRQLIDEQWEEIRAYWDEKNPHNLVEDENGDNTN